jgi:hypothetical protein
MRAAASVAANYRSTCISRSRPEFVARLGTVLEEADEALFWADHLGAECSGPVFDAVLEESHEMAAIFGASYRTARANLKAAEEAEAVKASQSKSTKPAQSAKSAKSAKSPKSAKSANLAKSAK